MKTIIITLSILLSVTACSQKKTNQLNPTTMQTNEITADNIVEKIASQVKHYPQEPIYLIGYNISYTNFEIYINDIPSKVEFSNYSGGTAFDINHLLFKNGKYSVKYKMYPVGKIEGGKVYNEFLNSTSLRLQTSNYDKKESNPKENIIKEYRTPFTIIEKTYDKEERFDGAGKKYYEGEFTIDVQVPYELHPPFEEAQDLRKMDKKVLEEKLLKANKKLWEAYNKKDFDKLAKSEYHSSLIEHQAFYNSKKEVQEAWDEMVDIIKQSSFQMQPIGKYKVEIYGNGKLARLMADTDDKRHKGFSILWAKVHYDSRLRPFFINNYFYLPAGASEFEVY